MARSRGALRLFSCIDSRIIEKAEESLAESGITLEYAAASGVDIRDCQQSSNLFKKIGLSPGPAAIVYRYASLNEKGVVTPIPEDEFLRFKPLVIEEKTGFEAQTKPKSKYLQLGAGSRLYIPTVHDNLESIDWATFLKELGDIKVSEGEKKALSAVYRGLLTVAVGGKDSFYISKYEKRLLKELEILCHKRRTYIIYDIDKGFTSYKPDVSVSVERLGRALSSIGSDVRVVMLPSEKDEKLGLDDWLVKNPNAQVHQLKNEIEKYSLPSASAEALFKEFNTYVFVSFNNALGHVVTRELLPLNNYLEEKGNLQVVINELKICNDEHLGAVVRSVPKVTTLGKAFMTSHARPTVSKANIYPGDFRVVVEEENSFNMWPGYAQEVPSSPPTKKDLAVFFEFMEGFHGKDSEYLINWFLWPLKYPGDKLFTIPVLKHHKEGIGKSTMAELLGEYVYGKEFWTIVGADKLNKISFKVELVGGKMLTVIDDADDVEVSSTMSAIKGIVTQKFITVIYKYMNKCTIRNYTNIIINTNRERPFYMTKNDRRFAYPECTTKYWQEDGKVHEMFIRLHKWFEQGGGGKLIAYAAKVHDFKEFDPKAAAPMTKTKQEQIAESESPLQECVKKIVENDVGYGREIYTFTELKTLVEQMLKDLLYDNYKFNYPQLVAALKEEGVVSLGVVPVRGTTLSLYAIKNGSKWVSKDKEEIEKEIEKEIVQIKKSTETERVEQKKKADVIELSRRLTSRRKGKHEK